MYACIFTHILATISIIEGALFEFCMLSESKDVKCLIFKDEMINCFSVISYTPSFVGPTIKNAFLLTFLVIVDMALLWNIRTLTRTFLLYNCTSEKK